MYVPAAFQVDDPEKIAQFIAEHSFATVITQHAGSPFASAASICASSGALSARFVWRRRERETEKTERGEES